VAVEGKVRLDRRKRDDDAVKLWNDIVKSLPRYDFLSLTESVIGFRESIKIVVKITENIFSFILPFFARWFVVFGVAKRGRRMR
jgi:hypothetical protein